LLDLSGLPRGIEVMESDEAFLNIDAVAHLLGAAYEHANGALTCFLDECLLLGVGFSSADGGDLVARITGNLESTESSFLLLIPGKSMPRPAQCVLQHCSKLSFSALPEY
jgi:hypothetical protein